MMMKEKPLISYLRILEKEGLTEPRVLYTDHSGEQKASVLSAPVSGLFYDSRKCVKDGIFFCKGRHFLPNYLTEVIQKGCTAVVFENEADISAALERPKKKSVCVFIKVKNVRKAMAALSAFHYGYPMRRAVTVAITGTKGKTGTVTAIRDALNQHSDFNAIILNDALPSGSPRLTTPEPIELHSAAAECIKRGATHIICEISSQGLKDHRTHGVVFDIACFLNFGIDHLSPDEHPTLDDYFNSKASLFSACRRAVVNLDSERSSDILSVAKKSEKILSLPTGKEIYTFSLNDRNACFFANIIEESTCGSLIDITENRRGSLIQTAENCCGNLPKTKKISLPFPLYINSPGRFNVENALAVFSVCRVLGCTYSEIFRGILFSGTPGRMEVFDTADGKVRVIVDYAHNKISFEALFNAAKQMYAPTSVPKITAVFGCPGDKARCRRYDLPYVALHHSDRIIICEDDSGTEPFEKIRDEILSNAKKILSDSAEKDIKKTGISIIKSRESAISAAVTAALENGERRLILFMGKGRENTMAINGEHVPILDDTLLTKKAIKEYNDRLSIDALFTSLGKKRGSLITVSLENKYEVIHSFAATVSRFLNAQIPIVAVCDKDTAKVLSEECFKNGTVCHFTDHIRSSYSDQNIKSIAISSVKRGALTVVVVSESIGEAAVDISVREKSDALVYLTQNGGIMINVSALPRVLSEKSAKAVLRHTGDPHLRLAVKAIKGGVPSVAVIDGREKDAFSFYGIGIGFKGTVINKD